METHVLSNLVVAVLLLVCLRAPGGLVVAMSKTLVVLVWTVALMALAAVPITLVTTILPVLLLALAQVFQVTQHAGLRCRNGGAPRTADSAGSCCPSSPPAARRGSRGAALPRRAGRTGGGYG